MEERYGWKVQLAESSSTAHRHAHHHLLLQHIASPQLPLAVHITTCFSNTLLHHSRHSLCTTLTTMPMPRERDFPADSGIWLTNLGREELLYQRCCCSVYGGKSCCTRGAAVVFMVGRVIGPVVLL